MKRSISFLSILIFSIIFLSVLQVAVSSKLSTYGVELANLQEDLSSFKKENSLLKENLLMETSLINIASQAAVIGFAENKSRLFLTAPLPIARK